MPWPEDDKKMDLIDLDDVRPVPFAAAAPKKSVTAPSFVPHELAGQVGAEVAAPLSAALERVNLLSTTGKIGRGSLRALREEIELARRVAMTGQQISRLASGRVKPAPETLELPLLLRDMLAQRSRELESRGLEVRQTLQPAPLTADPTLMFTLLQSLLDWAIQHCCGRTIELTTDVRTWPVHARLVCEFAWQPADEAESRARTQFDREVGDDATVMDTIAWRLIERVAHTVGVLVQRDDGPFKVRLELEFPPVTEVRSRTTPKVVGFADSERLSLNSEPMAGSHVLIVSTRREVRNLAREAVRAMGLMVDYVTTIEEAREFCRGGMPHAVVCDEAMAGLEQLRHDLREEVAGLAFLQISDEVQSLEVQTRGGELITRIGLNSLVESLPPALLYALERAR